MPRLLDTQLYLDTVCELLEQGETSVAVPVAGSSMTPFLINGDTVYLDLPQTPVKRGDIVLYTRDSGRYVLHRVWRANKDGSFLMVGDAQLELEYIPGMERIRARVSYVRHKGKCNHPNGFRWWFYRYPWMWLRPMRHVFMNMREWFRFKKTKK